MPRRFFLHTALGICTRLLRIWRRLYDCGASRILVAEEGVPFIVFSPKTFFVVKDWPVTKVEWLSIHVLSVNFSSYRNWKTCTLRLNTIGLNTIASNIAAIIQLISAGSQLRANTSLEKIPQKSRWSWFAPFISIFRQSFPRGYNDLLREFIFYSQIEFSVLNSWRVFVDIALFILRGFLVRFHNECLILNRLQLVSPFWCNKESVKTYIVRSYGSSANLRPSNDWSN